MKKMMKNLQNEKGEAMIEMIIVVATVVFLIGGAVTLMAGDSEEPAHEFGAAQAEQAVTTESKPLDVFNQMAKDVSDFQADAGYMTTDERQSMGYALLERLDVLLEQAEIAGNQEVVEEILTQQLSVEKEMNYGL